MCSVPNRDLNAAINILTFSRAGSAQIDACADLRKEDINMDVEVEHTPKYVEKLEIVHGLIDAITRAIEPVLLPDDAVLETGDQPKRASGLEKDLNSVICRLTRIVGRIDL
jgi:hypothetical protein